MVGTAVKSNYSRLWPSPSNFFKLILFFLFVCLFAALGLIELLLDIPTEDPIFPPVFSVFVVVSMIPFSTVLFLTLLKIIKNGTLALNSEGVYYCAALRGPIKNRLIRWDEIQEVRLHTKTNRIELILTNPTTIQFKRNISSQESVASSFNVKDAHSSNKSGFVIGLFFAPTISKAYAVLRNFPVHLTEHSS